MLDALRKRGKDDEQGFTLIELLVVVIIIGILAAIAIPVFLNQRERAWQRAVQSDLRNNSVVLEDFFSENGTYVAATGLRWSPDVTEGAHVLAADSYCITASHDNEGTAYELDSTVGTVAEGSC